MEFLENLLSKLTLTDLKTAISDYLELYTKPLKIWKKILHDPAIGFHLVVMHLIYYSILVFIVLFDLKETLTYLIFEIALTLIPFLIFLIPFLLLNFLFRTRYKSKILFQLIILLKMQFLLPFILIYSVTSKTHIEALYIFPFNISALLWIFIMTVLPCISSIRFWKKIIWILMNYLFFLSFLFLVYLIPFSTIHQVKFKTPDFEYANFVIDNPDYSDILDNTKYLLVLDSIANPRVIANSQFVSNELETIFYKSQLNETQRRIIQNDSLLDLLDHKHKHEFPVGMEREVFKYFQDSALTRSLLDSFKTINNKAFYSFKDQIKRAADSANFQSNKQYFLLIGEYLHTYDSLFLSNDQLRDYIRKVSRENILRFDNSAAFLMPLDTISFSSVLKRLHIMEYNFEKREARNNFLLSILTKPIELIVD